MKSKLILKLSLSSDPRLLCVVRAAVGEMAATEGFAEAEVRSMVLAVDEALANVIRHAYAGEPDRPIQVSFLKGHARKGKEVAETIEIRLLDSGKPVNAEKLQGRSLDDVRPGGLGLHFIRETMDGVKFSHRKGRNYLRLIKFLTLAKPASTETGDVTCK